MIIWSFGSFAFFLVPYYLQDIKGANIYDLSLGTEIAEFLASIICMFISRIMNLKKALFIFCGLVSWASIGLLIYFFIRGDQEATTTSNLVQAGLIMVCNLGVVCAFDIAYLINPELFPTMVLATAYGACNVLGRFISIFSPIVAKIANPYPLFILIAFSAICSMLTFKLNQIK